MSLIVYGIPNCATCKKAMQWLLENEIDYKFVNTKEQPPNKKEIADWVNTLGFKSMRNTSGKSYRALGDRKNAWDSNQWIDEFSKDAMLLKRPLFVKEDRAILVGFRASESEKKAKLLD